MEWDLEWGPHLKTLMKAKQMGMNPQALQDMPSLPWYYSEFLSHFSALNRARTYSLVQGKDKSFRIPNPIDIPSILQYNEAIVKMSNPSDFLDIVQTLDDLFMTHSAKRMAKV
jgi:hypothetical protein